MNHEVHDLAVDDRVAPHESGADSGRQGRERFGHVTPARYQPSLALGYIGERAQAGPHYHQSEPQPNGLLFPTESGTPYRIGNYLKRTLKPSAVKAEIQGLTYQAVRRTFATHFQGYALPKDAQGQLRHSKLEMTG